MGNNNLNFYLSTLHCNCSFSTTTSFPFARNMLCLFAILFPKTIPIHILQFKFLMFFIFGHRPILHIFLRRSTEFLNRILALQSKAARQFFGGPLLPVYLANQGTDKPVANGILTSRVHHEEHNSNDYC